MTKKWISKKTEDQSKAETLANALGVDFILAQLLVSRGIEDFETARQFFRPDLTRLLDPFLMKDMDLAVSRLTKALSAGEKILVYGDYDVDGTTAVTMTYSFLSELGGDCLYYIPDRYKEGYGFSFLGVDYAAENEISLIITLDCGIRDEEKIKYAKDKGIDVIVCDHHQVVDLPQAYAVLDPLRSDCSYPDKGLSGCGVGFKMLQAYCIKNNVHPDNLFRQLDLLAISIGADIVPLVGENRILAYHGLELLNQKQRRPGIQAMLDSAGFKKPELTISDAVFIIAPRINAAGRIVSATQAVELLLSNTLEEALQLSPSLEQVNSSRKELDKSTTTEAQQIIKEDDFYTSSFTTVLAGKGWHKGVVGIVASRLIDEYYRPTIVLVDNGETMSGSARSIKGIDLFEVLDECSDLLEQFGGHTMAAGLSMKSSNFNAFRERFDSVVKRQMNNQYPIPFIEYDAEISLEEINPKFYRILKQFAPFGPKNMRPVFLAKKLINAQFTKTVGLNDAHLKLRISPSNNNEIQFSGIGFDLGKWATYIQNNGEVDILFSLEENTFNGVSSLQLFVKDIRKSL